MPLITVACCNLAQHSLDYLGNRERILRSIAIAKSRGCTFRSGPELEISGYGLLDHHLELDTYTNSLEILFSILEDVSTHGIILDIGLPIWHRSLRLNCRCLALNSKILLLKPKMYLANDGNHRELRYFQNFEPHQIESYRLPPMFHKMQGDQTCPIGDGTITTQDTMLGFECCEEMWSPRAPHIDLTLAGCEIIVNSSASHFSLRKISIRHSLLLEASRKCGGIYLYSNQMGMDGDRLLYDGTAMIIVNGQCVAASDQFTLDDVQVVSATVDLDEVRAYRSTSSRGLQAVSAPQYTNCHADISLGRSGADLDPNIIPSPVQELRKYEDVEEIALAPAVWMWHYLVKSRAAGFLLPLSGGIDSASTLALVFSLCRLVVRAIEQGNERVKADVARIAGPFHEKGWMPKTAQELNNCILHTIYLGMAKQSSAETRSRAKRLAAATGAYFRDIDIDNVFDAQKDLLRQATGFEPNFRADGGTETENLALQNIQARSRMVSAYYFAQTLPLVRQRPGGGSLLVLGSGNLEEALRGYLTKYDCSSADINPIGSVSKRDLKRFLAFAKTAWDLPILQEFLEATPTAELEPISEDYVQSDEIDMGLTYAQLAELGAARKILKLGPHGCFRRMLHLWSNQNPREVATIVKRFFHFYGQNRHKSTTLTPSLFMEEYSCDDNRFDMRPFLYLNYYESYDFKKIDHDVEEMEKKKRETGVDAQPKQ